eukprot:15598-Heterococcus_DN1.PRE.1
MPVVIATICCYSRKRDTALRENGSTAAVMSGATAASTATTYTLQGNSRYMPLLTDRCTLIC